MPQKIAVAIIHGIGKANPRFPDKTNPKEFTGGMAKQLKSQFAKLLGEEEKEADSKLEIEAIYWAPVLQDPENEMWRRLQQDAKLEYRMLRDFIFNSLADSVAYQITSSAPPSDRRIYDEVHQCFATTLRKLAQSVGEKAPLCIIAHSLGSVIASNYIWDIQNQRSQIAINDNPLEKGETLALFYTLGSQIALWGLRYDDFGTPVAIPSPQLSQHYPNLTGEWVNFYDQDDILGYPIKTINKAYERAVKADIPVNAGNPLESWNPFSHNGYWTDDEVTKPIAHALVKLWKSVNFPV